MAKYIYIKLLVFALFLTAATQTEAKCDWYKINTNWSSATKGGVITVGLNLSNYPCIQESWSLSGGAYVKGYYTSFTVQKNGTYRICMKLVDTCNKCDTVICKEIKVDGIKTCQWYKMNTNWSASVWGGNISVGLNIANFPCVQEFWSLAGGAYTKGTSAKYTVSKNGIYSICMKLYDTCLKCDTLICKEIKVDGIKSCNVDFVADITKDGVKFKPLFPCNGKAVYSWKFGNGTFANTGDPFVKFAKGTYEVCLTAKCYTYDQINNRYDSCEAKICKKIVIKENPCELKGDFYFKVGDKNMITFIGYANDQNLIYSWTIDNIERKGRDFALYLTPGVHKVCMTIYNAKTGCKFTVCKTIEIPKPKMECKVDFTAQITRDGVKFKPNFPCNGTATYSWKFGNGTYSNNFDPFVKYAKGTYEVCLYAKCKVYNQDKKAYDSCETKICKQIVIKESPCELKGDFSFKIGDNGVVTFIATGNSNNLLYYWTIDNYERKGRDFNMTLAPGTHKVCLTIYDQKTNCKITICRTITIPTKEKCNLPKGWGSTNVCAAFTFEGFKAVDANGTAINNPCHKYAWDFGDKTTATGRVTKHEYTQNGTYTVCMKVIDTCKKCDTVICKTIKVDCLKKCNLPKGWSQGNTTCSSYYFDGYKVIEGNTEIINPCHKYSWDFGDKTTAIGKTVKHEFTKPGTYTVCMKVVDTCLKCDTVICKQIIVKTCCNSQMSAEFSDTLKLGGTVRFVNRSTGGVYYKWLFGDNTTSADKNISHTYANAGSYVVCLVAYDSSKNCTDTFCKTIQVTIKRGSMESMAINGANFANWALYPNPVTDFVTISGYNFEVGDIIRIKDIAGKTILEININKAASETIISMEHLVPGIYTIQCQTIAGNSIQSKLIKQ